MNQPGSANPIEAVRARLDGGRKWHKGAYHDGAGNRCLLGAGLVVGVTTRDLRLVQSVAVEQFPERQAVLPGHAAIHPIAQFNDHPDTTWADVALVLDKAEIALAEQVQP